MRFRAGRSVRQRFNSWLVFGIWEASAIPDPTADPTESSPGSQSPASRELALFHRFLRGLHRAHSILAIHEVPWSMYVHSRKVASRRLALGCPRLEVGHLRLLPRSNSWARGTQCCSRLKLGRLCAFALLPSQLDYQLFPTACDCWLQGAILEPLRPPQW